MQQDKKQQFDLANKLIFVRSYEKADNILAGLVNKSTIEKDDLIIHLRRIELATKIDRISQLYDYYRRHFKGQNTPETAICLNFVKQYGELVSGEEIIADYQKMMADFGAHAAIYYGLGLAYEMTGNLERAVYHYEQSLLIDTSWYPSYFGLSQIYYNTSRMPQGDQNFYAFEKLAPYNVYGNFETHRELFQEFLQAGRFTEAEAAISALSQWWYDHKGSCPEEIQIYEYLAIARSRGLSGDQAASRDFDQLAKKSADFLLTDPKAGVQVLYFVARLLEEFSENALALDYYIHILGHANVKADYVQRVGAQLISRWPIADACRAFDEALKRNPSNHEVKFCNLVAQLKLAGVDVEKYLAGKERMKVLVETDGDGVELLALLHSLTAQFNKDAEVYACMGDLQLRLQNLPKARKCYESMFQLAPYSSEYAVKLATFYLESDLVELADQILAPYRHDRELNEQRRHELDWLFANLALIRGDLEEAAQVMQGLLNVDTWNVSYLCLYAKIIQKKFIASHPQFAGTDDGETAIAALLADEKQQVQWHEFNKLTRSFEHAKAFEVVYCRERLAMLFHEMQLLTISNLVKSAIAFDVDKACHDFLALVNTNFDAAEVYWGLGKLFKEQWQLEASSMWMQFALSKNPKAVGVKLAVLAELADNCLWQEHHSKAVQYGQIALELSVGKPEAWVSSVLAHAYIKSGQVAAARNLLEGLEGQDTFDAVYLRGLMQYRDGYTVKAKEIWKPLIQKPSVDSRSHYIKQQMLKYYYQADPYLKAAN